MMLKSSLFITLLLGAVAAIPISSQASPAVPQNSPAISNIVPAQG
jgi:hypothetical protein